MSFGIAVITASATALEAAMDAMRAKFAPTTEQTLSNTREDGSTRTAQATVDDVLDVDRFSDRIARVVVNFTLCKPYFRLSTAIGDNTTIIDASPHAMTVTNPGTVEERDPVITLTAPLSNTVITNSTNGCILTYAGSLTAADVVIIQTGANGEYTAVKNGTTNVIGNVTHSGESCLMKFDVGGNTLAITDGTATTGTVKVSFYAPFL
jgi:hypothetical protein